MKVLLLHHRHGLGGGERSLLNLIDGWKGTKVVPSLACPGEGRFAEELRRRRVRVYPMSFRKLRRPWVLGRAWRRLSRLIREEGFDLVHGNSPQTNLVAGLVGKTLGKPVVWHARVLLEDEGVDWDRRLAMLASAVVCNSEAIRRRFASVKDFEERTVTVLNGVDLGAFSPGCADGAPWRENLGLADELPVVGSFDRLDPVKNHEMLLRAFKTVRDRLGTGALVVAGEAFVRPQERLSELKALAQGLGLGPNVIFLGFTEDVRPAMAACDVIVQASRSEGCSRVLCEAQAMGKPVVATRVGGNPEIVRHGLTGFLCPLSDEAAFADRIACLLEGEGRRVEMGRAARAWAEQGLSRERQCREIEKVYERVCS